MTLALSLVAILALLALTRVCRRQKLTPPPLRIPLIAAVLIPLLTVLTGFMGDQGVSLVQKSLAMSISLMWAISLIRLMSWAIFQVPPFLGWWKPTAKILRDLSTLAVISAVTLVLLHRYFSINLVGLAATSAVVTAVLGLAAQETLKNLFAGISLQVDSPFEEGDWIDLGGTRGVVTSLRLMTTHVRSLDGSITVVPNSRITMEGLRRFKPQEPVGQTIDLGLDYSLPPRQAIQLLQRTLRTNRKVLSQPPPKVWIKAFADSAITYRLMTWQTSALELQQLKSDLLEQIWYSLQRIHQSIPYPIRDIRTEPSQARLPSNKVTQLEKQQLLAGSEIFGHLSHDQLTTLANAARCQCFAPGETVVCQGDHGDSLYVVASGNLDVFKTSGSTSAHSWPGQQVASLHKTSIFGEMALCTGESRTASVICKDECVLLEIERKHLQPLLEEQPKILETMGSIVAARQQQLDAIKSSKAENRRLALIARMQRLFSQAGQKT